MQQAVSLARGQIQLPTGEIRHVTLPFDPRDFDSGTPSGALNMASLVVPDTLLGAYEATGNESYFAQATQAILAFGDFERDLLTDLGNVRNDHAIVARVGVLTRFWRLYRTRPDFDEAVARKALQQMTRCAEFLGKQSHFTAATNHGVMQNIGLLQAAVAFPDIPGASRWREIARSRLSQQMAFYVNGEGVVLEDGPGYHRFGIELLGMVLQLLDWNGLPAIDGLPDKYARGLVFLNRLVRPDGSIPRIGDTNGAVVSDDGGVRYPAPAGVADRSLSLSDGTHLYPNAGYAITERALKEQTGAPQLVSHATVYWSHFPGHGHEIAGEGSFVLWAAGVDWLGNTGYWPYGLPGRDEATGWRGSSAPHIHGEAPSSIRTAVLLTYGADRESHVLDLVRSLEGGPRLRRQIVQIDDASWLVLDSLASPITETVDRLWTLGSPLAVEDDAGGDAVVAKDSSTGWTLQMRFLGQTPPLVRKLLGSLEPFGGWVVNGPRPVPAQSYEVAQGPGSQWVATVINLIPPGAAQPKTEPLIQYNAEDDWSASLGAGDGNVVNVRRLHDRLLVDRGRTTARDIELLSPATAVRAERDAIQDSLARTTREFHRFQAFLFYRLRLTYAVAAAALISMAVLYFTARRWRRLHAPMTALALVLWLTAAGWIHWAYLAQ